MAIKKVCIQFAMLQEAEKAVASLGLTASTELSVAPLPCQFFTGVYKDLDITLVLNGECKRFPGIQSVGTIPAALTTHAVLQLVKPDLLINPGTCGGFNFKGGKVGDVYIGASVANHDRRIAIPVQPLEHECCPTIAPPVVTVHHQGYGEYGVMKTDATPTPNLIKALGWKEGLV